MVERSVDWKPTSKQGAQSRLMHHLWEPSHATSLKPPTTVSRSRTSEQICHIWLGYKFRVWLRDKQDTRHTRRYRDQSQDHFQRWTTEVLTAIVVTETNRLLTLPYVKSCDRVVQVRTMNTSMLNSACRGKVSEGQCRLIRTSASDASWHVHSEHGPIDRTKSASVCCWQYSPINVYMIHTRTEVQHSDLVCGSLDLGMQQMHRMNSRDLRQCVRWLLYCLIYILMRFSGYSPHSITRLLDELASSTHVPIWSGDMDEIGLHIHVIPGHNQICCVVSCLGFSTKYNFYTFSDGVVY